MFLVNAMPHFIHGIAGDGFPTPFANPPGKGLSSPLINVIWGLVNLLMGYVLYRGAKISKSNPGSVWVFFAGIATMSIMCSLIFVDKMH
jgi:hypothetical protein